MRAEDRIRLLHMVEASQMAMQFVSDRTRNDLDTDRMLLFAVVRAIEVIGEAANNVSGRFAAHPSRHSLESHGRHAQPP